MSHIHRLERDVPLMEQNSEVKDKDNSKKIAFSIHSLVLNIFIGLLFGIGAALMTIYTFGLDLVIPVGIGALAGITGAIFRTILEKKPKVMGTPPPTYERVEDLKIEAQLEEVAEVLEIHSKGNPLRVEELDQILDLVDRAKGDKKAEERHFADGLKKAIGEHNAREAMANPLLLMEKMEAGEAHKLREERRAKLQVVINQVYVNRALKEKGKLVCGSNDEQRVLEYLGYPLDPKSPYFDKDKLYEMIQETIQRQLMAEGYVGSFASVKETLHDQAQRVRLQVLGINTDVQVEKFRATVQFVNANKSWLKKDLDNLKLELPPEFPFKDLNSLTIEQLSNALNSIRLRVIKGYIGGCITDYAKEFFNSPISLDEYKKKLEGIEIEKIRKQELIEVLRDKVRLNFEIDEDIQGMIHFMNKWGKYFVREFIQGYRNEDEVLGIGACWGNSHRLRMEGQKNPDWTVEEAAQNIEIKPSDRFYQLLRSQAIMTGGKEEMERAEAFMAEHNGFLPSKLLFDFIYDPDEPDLENWLKRNQAKLQDSHGWILIRISLNESVGHVIDWRLDDKRQRAWLYDPNIGFASFERPGVPFEESRDLLIQCYKDLARFLYKDSIRIKAEQLLPKIV